MRPMRELASVTMSAVTTLLSGALMLSALIAPSYWYFTTDPAVTPPNLVMFVALPIPVFIGAIVVRRTGQWAAQQMAAPTTTGGECHVE